jgi:hypothetical protein
VAASAGPSARPASAATRREAANDNGAANTASSAPSAASDPSSTSRVDQQAISRSLASAPARPPTLNAVSSQPPADAGRPRAMASSGSSTGSGPWKNCPAVVAIVTDSSSLDCRSSRSPSAIAAGSDSRVRAAEVAATGIGASSTSGSPAAVVTTSAPKPAPTPNAPDRAETRAGPAIPPTP